MCLEQTDDLLKDPWLVGNFKIVCINKLPLLHLNIGSMQILIMFCEFLQLNKLIKENCSPRGAIF